MRLANRHSDARRATWPGAVRRVTLGVALLVASSVHPACARRNVNDAAEGSASERLQPVTQAAPAAGVVRRTVYVPIYSSLYLGRDIRRDMVQLTSTLSVRNVSPQYPITIESVRYYDSNGRPVKDHLSTASELAALASVEFVVKEADTTGGPGANFLVTWSGPTEVDEPLIEAIMLGRSANAGISFTSSGRTIRNEPQ